MSSRSINPCDGKLRKSFEPLADEQFSKALGTAAACFEAWRHTYFAERASVAVKVAAILRARIEEVVRPVTTGMGKLIAEAMMFVNQHTWTKADLPFGGIKDYGNGRELGRMAIQEFVNKNLVWVESIGAPV